MPLPPEHAWFPTKTYGWGWGLPRRWQGWVVVVAFFAALAGATPLLPRHALWYVIVVNAAAAGNFGKGTPRRNYSTARRALRCSHRQCRHRSRR